MPTALTKPVTRRIENTPLRPAGFRGDYVVRMTDSGVQMKPSKGRWSKAFLATWADILQAGAIRKMHEAAEARRARRAARKAGG